MDSKGTIRQPGAGSGTYRFWKRSGLQMRMTMSYVWVTVMLVLLLEVLVALTLAFVLTSFVAPYVYTLTARHVAERYAYAAALQARASTLNPDATFADSRPGSLVLPEKQPAQDDTRVPYITTLYPDTHPVAFALLVAADRRVIASSYPRRYPSNTFASTLLLEKATLINNALAGKPASGTAGGNVYAVETVWSRDGEPVGAIYVQIPRLAALQNISAVWQPATTILLLSSVLLLVITIPIGGLFGLLTTRGLVRRVRTLAAATTQFAAGQYSQRVPITGGDEIGGLEEHFNRMAAELATSIAQRQTLAGQNARLEERARITRELHDAISQDLFSLRMLGGGLRSAIATGSDLQSYVETLEEATARMIREMRALLLELRPGQLAEMPLAGALEALAMAYRTRLGMSVTASISPVELDASTEHALLRIAQEALTNAVRHAAASSVTLSLQSAQDTIEFEIVDDGKGFEPTENSAQYGLGLRLMRERVEELHGTFSLHAVAGHGTRISIRLPQEKAHD